MEEGDAIYIKVFDRKKGDVVFEGKVSTDVEPGELVKLGCFWDRCLQGMYKKATDERVTSFKGLQNNVELVADRYGSMWSRDYVGALYVNVCDGVVRKSESVPSCECVKMTVWWLLHEECENVFKCETLEELEMYSCGSREIPSEIGKMKKLKKLRLRGLEVKSIPEEIVELSSLEELWIEYSEIESLPKRLKNLKMLTSILLDGLDMQLYSDDVVVLSKLKHLRIVRCNKLFSPSFAHAFWEMIKATTHLRVLELDWNEHDEEMVVEALKENGSIVDGAKGSEDYAHFFKRNKENHERARECVVHLLAIRRWRNALHVFPREMVKMISVMLWVMKCDVNAWSKR